MRRPPRPPLRAWVWTAATLVLVVVAALLWRNSDAAATDSTTAPAGGAPEGSPAAELTPAWSAAADPRFPPTVVEGRVLVGTSSGIVAREATTGEEDWHYTRANARMCGMTAVDGLVVAVFRTEQRCDEAVGLRAGTGIRAWTRNLDLRPDATLTGAAGTVLATSPTGILALHPEGNSIRWRERLPEGCRALGSAAGSALVAVLQRCSATVQLRGHDSASGDLRWTRDVAVSPGAEVRMAGADGLVSLVVDDELRLHGAEDGDLLATIGLPPPRSEVADDPLLQTRAGDTVLVAARGTLWALDAATASVRWERPALGLPTGPVTAEPAEVLVPEEEGFVRRDLMTGEAAARSRVADLPVGGRATAVGPAVVLVLPERVLVFG